MVGQFQNISRAQQILDNGKEKDKRVIQLCRAIVSIEYAQAAIRHSLHYVASPLPKNDLVRRELQKADNTLRYRASRLLAVLDVIVSQGAFFSEPEMEQAIMERYQNSLIADGDEEDHEQSDALIRDMEAYFGRKPLHGRSSSSNE
jgi:hypothetical protein